MPVSAKDREGKMLMATIDVGAHSARMLLAEVDLSTGSFEALEDLEQPVPLGSNVFQRGRISNKSIRMLCEIFHNFRTKMDEYGVQLYKAIATSAVRESANAEIFIERIRHETGIKVNIFEGVDEARLDYLAVSEDVPKRFGFQTQRAMIADIGTGACQVSLYEKGLLCFTETIRVGTLRVLESMSETLSSVVLSQSLAPVVGRAFSELEHTSQRLSSDVIIAMGSSVRALLPLLKRNKASSEAISLTHAEFMSIFRTVMSMGVEQLGAKYSIRTDLAEATTPCCLIIDNLFRLTGAKMMVIPMTSTKYALLKDFINETAGGKDYFSSQIFEMVKRIAGKYRCDNDYTDRVVDLSERLFEKLKSLHGLGHRELLILKIAAALHKAGLFINNQAYHKHSCYIILNTEIAGLSPEERKLAAMVARYHRKSMPKPQHVEYMALQPCDRAVVNKLSSMLRLACMLAEFVDPSRRLSVKINPDNVVVHAEDGATIQLSNGALIAEAEHFHYVFARRIMFR